MFADRLTAAAAALLTAGDRPAGGLSRLYRETVVPAGLDETFAFFADAANLGRLTPSWLDFRILTPMPVEMRAGLEIDYRIVLYGVPIPWRTRIDVWEPGVRFVDRQIVGPYRWWLHEHRFSPAEAGTLVVDHVQFEPRAAWLSGPLVRRNVERIFTYRAIALAEIFGAQA